MNLIVFSAKNPFANPGAASNRLLGLLKGLSNLGVDVKLLILQGYFSEKEHLEYAVEGKRNGINYVYISKRENITIWQRRITEYFYVFFETIIISRRINTFLKNGPNDSIIWLQNNALCYNLVKKSSINLFKIFVEMNEYPDIHKGNNSQKYIWQRWFSNRKSDLFYNDVLKSLDGFALMTEALIKHFEHRVHKKTRILLLPMTVDIERFDLSKTYDPIKGLDSAYIAFVGSMNDKKDGVNILIEAFASIASEFTNYKLALFGFWAYDTPRHLQRIKELGIEDKVIYSKPLDSENVVHLIMNAEVLVLPRPDSHQARGGFPTKLGEYLASSKPVIATAVGEIPNYLSDNVNVFFCDEGSELSLRNRLIEVLSNRELAASIGRNGRELAVNVFSTDVQSKRLFNFLKGI
jgi:glycosyltransferase involved in cell wall biosynthesis